MAYVTFVLDQGLCLSAAGLAATRPFVAKLGVNNRYGSVWTLASRQFALYPMGRVPRRFARIASAVATIRTPRGNGLLRVCHRNFRLDLYTCRDFSGMDFVSSQLAFASLEHAFLSVLGEIVFLSCIA